MSSSSSSSPSSPPRKPPRVSLSSSFSLSPGRRRKPPPAPPSPTTAAAAAASGSSSPQILYSPLSSGGRRMGWGRGSGGGGGGTTKLAFEDEQEEDEDAEEEEERAWRLREEEMDGSISSSGIHTRHIQLQALVEKRVLNLDYLRRTHAGGAHWLNTVVLSKDVIRQYVEMEVPPSRPLLFFHLGLSLAKLLELPPPSDEGGEKKEGEGGGEQQDCIALLRALAQIFEELEYHTSSAAIQSMKLLMAKPSDTPFPEQTPEGPAEPINPRIYRFGSEVVYENFFSPPVPFPVDYLECLDSLCHNLALLYQHLGHKYTTWIERDPALFETLAKIDAKVKHHVINPLAKELTEVTARLAKQELEGLREAHM